MTELVDNLRSVSQVFVQVGDLRLYPDDISHLFVKCMTSLSLQCPIVATLLALIFRAEPDFAEIVLGKLKVRLYANMAMSITTYLYTHNLPALNGDV